MLTTVQPTGVYSAFQRPVQAAVNAGQDSNSPLLNTPVSDKEKQKSKKTLKQKLPYLAALALAASFGVIYGIPAARLALRKKILKNQEAHKKPLIDIQNKNVKTVLSKASSSVNKFIDILECKVQKGIRKFLKNNFFKY